MSRALRPRPAAGREDPHLASLRRALDDAEQLAETAQRWGYALADVLAGGGRLLAAGNGGSAAQAQHLTAELVGRYVDERQPLSAICLSAETSTLTALANDYGADELFARQVRAHGRPGDVCVLFSTSGTSRNVLAAAVAAKECGLLSWALTGPGPNPLAAMCSEALCVPGPGTATVQELHLVALHMICEHVDARIAAGSAQAAGRTASGPTAMRVER